MNVHMQVWGMMICMHDGRDCGKLFVLNEILVSASCLWRCSLINFYHHHQQTLLVWSE